MKWSYEIKKEPQPIILSISPSTDFLVIDDYDIQYSILLNKEQTKELIKALNSDRIKEWLNDVKERFNNKKRVDKKCTNVQNVVIISST